MTQTYHMVQKYSYERTVIYACNHADLSYGLKVFLRENSNLRMS